MGGSVYRSETPTVLIVRGAGPAGRRIANAAAAAELAPIVMDERTCAHEGVESVRVSFEDAADPRRALHDMVLRHGRLDAVVLLPAAGTAAGAGTGPAWERDLGRELAVVAGLVRTAAPWLSEVSGVVVPVSAPPSRREPSNLSSLLAAVCEPAVRALASEFGFRVAPVVTDTTGTARGTIVGSALMDHLASPRFGHGVREAESTRIAAG